MQYVAQAMVSLVEDCGLVETNSPRLLLALTSDPGWRGWRGPYMDAAPNPLDPWQHPLVFAVSESRLRVSSAGPDGIFGTADDTTLEATVALARR
jgi:hypothetical protein